MMQQPNFLRRLALLSLAVLAFLNLAETAAAARARNVGLTSFTAIPVAEGVRLAWQTETELGTAGFRVARTQGTDTLFLTSIGDAGFVVGLGGVTLGATYEETDTTAVLGQTYTYELYEVEVDNSQHAVARQDVLVALPTPTRPIVVPTEAAAALDATSSPAAPTATTAAPPPAPPAATEVSPIEPAQAAAAVATGAIGPDVTDSNATVVGPADGGATGVVGAAIALAQEATPATGPDTYPALATPTLAFAPLDAAAQPTQPPYPPSGDSGLSPVPIGGEPGVNPAGVVGATPVATAVAAEGQGLPYLWLGFAATLLIFGASVLGAVILFTRRNDS